MLSDVLELVWRALLLDPAAFQAAAFIPAARRAAYAVAFLAGASELGGQGVILLLNRVRPWRFVLSLCLSGLVYVAGVAATAFGLWLTAEVVLRQATGPFALLGVVALSYAPRLFGFFVLAPYFGEVLNRVLDVWVLVALVLGLRVAFGLPFASALLCAGLGWLVTLALRAAFDRLFSQMFARLEILAAGRPLDMRPASMLKLLVERAKRESPGGP